MDNFVIFCVGMMKFISDLLQLKTSHEQFPRKFEVCYYNISIKIQTRMALGISMNRTAFEIFINQLFIKHYGRRSFTFFTF